jgi:hypothetical protein
VALTVVHAQRVALETAPAGQRQYGGGIQPAGQEHDGAPGLRRLPSHLPGVSPHKTL